MYLAYSATNAWMRPDQIHRISHLSCLICCLPQVKDGSLK